VKQNQHKQGRQKKNQKSNIQFLLETATESNSFPAKKFRGSSIDRPTTPKTM
jgi:hypothetical protein